MSLVVGLIDSLNFSNRSFEYLFVDKEKYSIVTVKSNAIGVSIFEPKIWLETFGKSLTKNIIEAKIIFTDKGLNLALVRYSRNPNMQTLIFAGINGYTEKAVFLKELLKELWEQLQESNIVRIDIACDFKGKIPNKVIKTLCTGNRRPYKPKGYKWNTTYYKTVKEKKTNASIDIKQYDKALKMDY